MCCCCHCRCGHHVHCYREHKFGNLLFFHYLVMDREERIQMLERYRKALSKEIERVEKVVAKLKEEE